MGIHILLQGIEEFPMIISHSNDPPLESRCRKVVVVYFEEILIHHFEGCSFLFRQYFPMVTPDIQIHGGSTADHLPKQLFHFIFQVIRPVFPEDIRTDLDIKVF